MSTSVSTLGARSTGTWFLAAIVGGVIVVALAIAIVMSVFANLTPASGSPAAFDPSGALRGHVLRENGAAASAAFDSTAALRGHVIRENGSSAAAFDPTAALRGHVLRENGAD